MTEQLPGATQRPCISLPIHRSVRMRRQSLLFQPTTRPRRGSSMDPHQPWHPIRGHHRVATIPATDTSRQEQTEPAQRTAREARTNAPSGAATDHVPTVDHPRVACGRPGVGNQVTAERSRALAATTPSSYATSACRSAHSRRDPTQPSTVGTDRQQLTPHAPREGHPTRVAPHHSDRKSR
jgi:hypothetical protein